MKPLFHPSVEDVTVEAILYALSDPVRVAIYAGIVGSEGSQNCSSFLKVSEKTIPRSTLSQHFKALREAGLIRGERRGVEMHNTSRCAEIDKRFPGLIKAIVNAHHVQAEGKTRASRPAKPRPAEVRPKKRSKGSANPSMTKVQRASLQ
ncbi:MAG TPA: helix-turn-helix domain-containing protein [Chthoniobacterales bacterium]